MWSLVCHFIISSVTPFLTLIFIGIMCLESKQMVHRNISYTNVFLRDAGPDSEEKRKYRAEVIELFGLSTIERLRERHSCREGLLIDFDYAATLVQSTNNMLFRTVRFIFVFLSHSLRNFTGLSIFHRY